MLTLPLKQNLNIPFTLCIGKPILKMLPFLTFVLLTSSYATASNDYLQIPALGRSFHIGKEMKRCLYIFVLDEAVFGGRCQLHNWQLISWIDIAEKEMIKKVFQYADIRVQ